MKRILLALFCAGLLTGCASRYDIITSTGSKFTGVTKPVLDHQTGVYHFKDASGAEHAISQSRVRVIAPAGEAEESFMQPPKATTKTRTRTR